MGHEGDRNLYRYANANPASFIDHTGLDSLNPWLNLFLSGGDRIQRMKQSNQSWIHLRGMVPDSARDKIAELYKFKYTDLDTRPQNWAEVFEMFLDWSDGYEITDLFGPGSPAVSDLRKTSGVQKAIEAYRNKNADCDKKVPWRDGAASFGPSRFWEATKTNNATAHYIGSFNIDIYPFPLDDSYMLIIVQGHEEPQVTSISRSRYQQKDTGSLLQQNSSLHVGRKVLEEWGAILLPFLFKVSLLSEP